MNFEFSDEQKQLRDGARRFLSETCTPRRVRDVLEGPQSFDRDLWKGLADLGFLGVAIPEEYGGAGAGHLELCVIAEELGRVVAPTPFSSSIALAAELIMLAGTPQQKEKYLPSIADGTSIGTLALAEGPGDPSAKTIRASVSGGKLSGTKTIVPDGDIADFAIVAARAGADERSLSLFIVDLKGAGVTRKTLTTIDPTRGQAAISFDNAAAEPLGATGEGWSLASSALDRAAVLCAFEQVGGADRALEMGRDYALDRMAFGRPIGSFQAVKHILADIYVAATLARSNAYYGAWALSTNSSELPEAAANARVSATTAYQLAAKNSIQVHGGVGFTWEYDCHLYYRRSNLLALSLGSLGYWENALIDRMRQRNAA